jgi:hypothetical protein
MNQHPSNFRLLAIVAGAAAIGLDGMKPRHDIPPAYRHSSFTGRMGKSLEMRWSPAMLRCESRR